MMIVDIAEKLRAELDGKEKVQNIPREFEEQGRNEKIDDPREE
jgi:hypothetical protein